MSSSFVLEPQESGSKKDDMLIIVVNDDGTISVDQETLQNLIMNQSGANVSVVRVGQTGGDAANGDLTLTVDPPAPFISPEAAISAASTATTDSAGLVDPFMEMDPEQLEKLETALQSEQAKQILGENVTAMLDMLTVEEQQKSIKYCIELDHCYTSRTSPSDPEPSDPLPIANSPDIDDNEYKIPPITQQVSQILVPTTFAEIPNVSTPPARPRVISNRPLLRPVITRGRKIAGPIVQQIPVAVAKPVNTVQRIASIPQQTLNIGTPNARVENEPEYDEPTSSSSESSESEPPSDDDSDFGPRGPRRGGVRARGGRKGLTTRGGSMAATRRRAANKQMDMEQVRRLDMEMAAAVDAMKSPEKIDKSTDRFSPVKSKKQLKTAGARKKEDPSPMRGVSAAVHSTSTSDLSAIESSPAIFEKPLQTTNQVKANLINANMIKGDMILTKPGQARNNQKVMFVQKKVVVRPNELRNHGLKKHSIIVTKGGKAMPLQIQTKLGTSEDGKLISVGGKTVAQISQEIQQETPTTSTPVAHSPDADTFDQQETADHSLSILSIHQPLLLPEQSQILESTVQQPQQTVVKEQKTVVTTVQSKIKTPEVKKEKKKSETEPIPKIEETAKVADTKTADATKKLLKKDPRKAPAIIADTLGPALFSTPDIIRRVSAGGDAKPCDLLPGTPTTPVSLEVACLTSDEANILPSTQELDIPSVAEQMKTHEEMSMMDSKSTLDEQPMTDMEMQMKTSIENESSSALPHSSVLSSEDLKDEMNVPTADDLDSSLVPAVNTSLTENSTEFIQSAEEPVVPNDIVSETSGIESEENLLATLEMEASKHDGELLAEALLLQEELGVDLAVHGGLVEPTATLPENLLSTTAFDTPMETAESHVSLVKTIESPKIVERVTEIRTPMRLVTTKAVSRTPEPTKKRDEREPIQIVRGGRVITLPPIEAPATRSKRLQVKAETPQKLPETPKREEKILKPTLQQQQRQNIIQQHIKEMEEMESEIDDEGDEDDNSDSEEDPNRLWCICKRPHSNRFMICCDVCEDWFHGKCVHVSKAMGQQMEEKGIEWVCPDCTKKKEQDTGVKPVKLESPVPKAPKQELTPRVVQPVQSMIQRTKITPIEKVPSKIATTSDHGMAPVSGVTQCVVCKKEARNSSIYCSDACILMHAQETLTKESKPPVVVQTKIPQVTSETVKTIPDARVIVFERRTGKVLTGTDAPTTSNFKAWLKENPTFEVVRPNNLNTLQIGGKTVTAIQTQGGNKNVNKLAQITPGVQAKMVYAKITGSKQTVLAASNKKLVSLTGDQKRGSLSPKPVQQQRQSPVGLSKSPGIRQTTLKILPQQVKSPATTPKQTPVKKSEIKANTPQQQQKQPQKTSPAKKNEPEPIRLNVRKTLTELLTTRIKETEDLKITDEEINELALNIELELYKHFRNTGAKYKAKYRSLVFNIKDTKNLTLFRKIADRSLTPDAVVRLSPDEMASQELAEWREKETKHQLEMIKKNELDLMAQAKSIVVKTHKGEQIIENEGGMDHVDPKTPVQDIVRALNSQDPSLDSGDERDDKNTASSSLSSLTLLPSIEDLKKSKVNEESKIKEREKRSKEKDRIKEKKEERTHNKSASRRSKDSERSRDKSKDDRRSTRNKDSGKRDGKSSRDRDKDRDRDRDKGRDKTKDKDRLKKNRSSRGSHKDYSVKDKDKKDEDRKRDNSKKGNGDGEKTKIEAEKPIEDRLWRHVEEETTTNTLDGNDSDVSDREPSSTVNIKTPDINEEPERSEREPEPQLSLSAKQSTKGQSWQTVWRGFVNMVDVAKFFITAQEVSGHAKDLMEDLPDTVDVVGRISHETVWDYISKMKKTGSKEILVIRLTAANDEEKIPYITLYSYLNSRSRLGVVGNVSKNIKDFYIMPFSRQSQIPPVLMPLIGPGFEDHRPHLLLGIIVRNKRKRFSNTPTVGLLPSKVPKIDNEASFPTTPIVVNASKDKISNTESPSASPSQVHTANSLNSMSNLHKELLLETLKDKQKITQMTLDSLNKAHVGMSRSAIDNATISKIVPELSSKIDILANSPKETTIDDNVDDDNEKDNKNKETIEEEADDGDEPYSPGEIDDDNDDAKPVLLKPNIVDNLTAGSILSPIKNSTELQRKMDELNRQIEEQKQQIQSISSSFLGDSTTTLPGLGEDPPNAIDMEEAYSPTDVRSFTPPPPGISKFSQPILDKVSDITIPANLQEILANVKRQEISKVDPYLPSKPSATFLPSVNSPSYPKIEKYTPSFIKSTSDRHSSDKLDNAPKSPIKESKSTLRSLSDMDLIKKAEEELASVAAVAAAEAAVAAAAAAAAVNVATITMPMISPSNIQTRKILVPHPFSSPPPPIIPVLPVTVFPKLQESINDVPLPSSSTNLTDSVRKPSMSLASDQPKPPGLEDEDLPIFPTSPQPKIDNTTTTPSAASPQKFIPKSGVVLSVKRKISEDGTPNTPPLKTTRTKSRWGQGPSE